LSERSVLTAEMIGALHKLVQQLRDVDSPCTGGNLCHLRRKRDAQSISWGSDSELMLVGGSDVAYTFTLPVLNIDTERTALGEKK
jgi:hypothetical protein